MASFFKVGKANQGIQRAEWANILMTLPKKVDRMLSKGPIYENQCFLFKSLVYSVAQYVGLWIRSFPQVMHTEEAAAVGEQLLRVLEGGMQTVLHLSAGKASPGLLFIILGSLGQFGEIIDDVRKYSQMCNDLICSTLVPRCPACTESPKIEHDQFERSQRLRLSVIDQMKDKVETDCNTLQAFLPWAYEQDKLALINNLESLDNVARGNLPRYYVSNCLIPTLKTGFVPREICIESKDLTFLPKGDLGSGTFAKVWKASWCNSPVAVKELNAEECSSFNDEIEVFSKLVGNNSPHIVQLLGHYETEKIVNDDTEKTRCLVLELMDKNLSALIGRPETEILLKVVDIILQIAKAMKHLHDNDVIYRDMKPANILVKVRADQSLLIKLADFGVSKANFGTGNNTSMRGTIMYMAPEMLKGGTNYSKKVDVFSFGVLCSQILTRQKKLVGNNVEQVETIRGELREKVSKMNIPMRLKNLINRCWEYEDSQRPTFAEICDELWGIKKYLLISEIGIIQNLTRHLRFPISWCKCSVPVMPKFLRDLLQGRGINPRIFENSSVKGLPVDELSNFTILCLELVYGEVEIIEPYQTLKRPFTDGDGVDPQNIGFENGAQDLGILGQFKKLLINQGRELNLSLGIGVTGKSTPDQIMFIVYFLKIYPIFNGIYIHVYKENPVGGYEVKQLLQELRQALPGFNVAVDMELGKRIHRSYRIYDHVFISEEDDESEQNISEGRYDIIPRRYMSLY